jgi:DNA-binding MarR family transcriptional regulator
MLRAEQGSMLAVWDEFGLSSSQGELLCSLEPRERAPMISLAKALHCHDSNVTGLVDKLEQRGLIARSGDPKDRRVKLIALTAEGEKLRERLLLRVYEPLPFIKALSAGDQRALRDILRKAV